jgi:CRISPR-associated endonuclease/helicase Cas3
VVHVKEEAERFDGDKRSFSKYRQTLADHTQQVCEAMDGLLVALKESGIDAYRAELTAAARLHDWGKAHPVMQETLQGHPGPYVELLAKSAGSGKHKVKYFRHELASALAMVAAGEAYLAAYLAAAHHGRVRVSIRSMPGERDRGTVCVRGIHQEDELLPCRLGSGVDREAVTLNVDPVLLGNGSWAGRALRLRDELGPFRLAYLEMLMRCADEAASAKGAE